MVESNQNKDKVKEWAKRQIEKGFGIDDIRKTLIESGYNEEGIKNIISDIEEKKPIQENILQEEPKKKKIFSKKIMLISTAIISIIVLAILINIFILQPEELFDDKEYPIFEKVIYEQFEKEKNQSFLYCTALINNDFAICNNLKDKHGCKGDIILFKAILNNDKSVCDLLKEENMGSYLDFYPMCQALVEKSSKGVIQLEKCDLIQSEDMKYLCKAILSEDSSYCDAFTTPEEQEDCGNSSILFVKGVLKRSKSLCEKIDYITERNVCSALITGDDKYCNDIIEEHDSQRNDIIRRFKETKGVDLCQAIDNFEDRQDCIAVVSLFPRNLQVVNSSQGLV